MLLSEEVIKTIKPLLGKLCCRTKVGKSKSLSLGFGEKVYHNKPQLEDTFYGEWEVGTYYCSWRIIKDSRILCASNDQIERLEQLDKAVKQIEIGSLKEIHQVSNFDVRLEFDSGVIIDFLTTISDEDESFHIFCPNNIYVELSWEGKWIIGKSNLPWINSA